MTQATNTLPGPAPSAPLAAAYVDLERRSPRWEGVRDAFLAKNPWCAACGQGVVHPEPALNVHHMVPVEFVRRAGRPELELDDRNLITLCEGSAAHHLLVGHLGDWLTYDPTVADDAARPECRTGGRDAITHSAWWLARRASMPKRASLMTATDLDALHQELARRFPLV